MLREHVQLRSAVPAKQTRASKEEGADGREWAPVKTQGQLDQLGPLRDRQSVTTGETPVRDHADPPPCDPGVTWLSELWTTSELMQAARPLSVSIPASQGWERSSQAVTL